MLKHFRSGSKRIRTLWWILTIGTVVTFIGGFIFIFGSGAGDMSRAMQVTDMVGKVGDSEVRQVQYANALASAQSSYEAQYGTKPMGRDGALLREQAWFNLVTERSVDGIAKRYGFAATDAEVVFAARNTPPPDITSNPAFMTNGQFDRTKWQSALADPTIDWTPLEERLRSILPAQRLEERVIAGVKISEPELQRLYANQYEQAKVSLVLLPLDMAPVDTTKLGDGALKAYYDTHKGEFEGVAQVKADIVQFPLSVGSDEDSTTHLEAIALVAEARGGRDFAELAKEQSEGPFADRGGDIGQDVPVSRLPAPLQPVVATMNLGDVTDPIRDGNTYFVFKLLNRTQPAGGEATVRLAQIQKPIRPSSESMQKDVEGVRKLRADAARKPIGELAAARGLVAASTGWFAQGQFEPSLMQMPHVQQWAVRGKKGEVSRAYGTETGWVIVQIVDRREAGPRPFEDVKEDVRRAVELTLRQAKPLADAEKMLAAVKAGKSLEQAATDAGTAVIATELFPRSNPDPRLTPAPRAVGLAFGLAVGATGGPVAAPTGVYLVRKDAAAAGDPVMYEQMKGNLSSQLLSSRQQRWLRAWIDRAVADTKVEDRRQDVEETL